MDINEIRKKYLQFFFEHSHAIIPSSSLVPDNDPTTLFTGSGMQPLLPFLLGERHPSGKRVANAQKCFRSGDIEEVGDNRHTTSFEMLGNWSFGDYWKREQLGFFFKFLTEKLHVDPKRLFVTAFIGESSHGIPKDVESAKVWQSLFASRSIEAKMVDIGSEADGYRLGMQDGRIFYYDSRKNWWSRSGVPDNMPIGEPGGADSEVFYDFGTTHNERFGQHCHPNCDCGRFVEIGNSVFMEYVRTTDGFKLLPERNVDFGGGLERIAMATNGSDDIFLASAKPLIEFLEQKTGRKYKDAGEGDTLAFRVITDHLKAATFLMADGVAPANTERGYFVRRLLRRAIRYADAIGLTPGQLSSMVSAIAEFYKDQYPGIWLKEPQIREAIDLEEQKFRSTLQMGLKEFRAGADPFILYTTFGFPIELTEELAKEQGSSIDRDKFDADMLSHRELSKDGSGQKFKSGLGDTSEISIKHHSATHLLHKALRDVLGESVEQRGSNITPERLRFDFSFPRKLTIEELTAVSDHVQQNIDRHLPVHCAILLKDEAIASGALHFFGDTYGEQVSVYYFGDTLENAYSKEFCGGPHVDNTGTLGKFRITKEEAVAAGIRRIKAVLE